MADVLKAVDLHKRFGEEHVLRGVDLALGESEIIAVVGRSGKGKSVLLKHLVGLLSPDSGHVRVDDRDLASLSNRELREVRGRFGYVFQDGALLDSLTIFENVALPLREVRKMDGEEVTERVNAELEQVHLSDAAEKYPEEISGGMVRRAALARALIARPEICLLDEPTTGLDPLTSRTILEYLEELHEKLEFTAVLVTHQIPDVFRLVHQVAMMHEGRIIALDAPEAILESENETVRRFIHGE